MKVKIKKLVSKIIKHLSNYCEDLSKPINIQTEYGYKVQFEGKKKEKYSFVHKDKIHLIIEVFILGNVIYIRGEIIDIDGCKPYTLQSYIIKDVITEEQ